MLNRKGANKISNIPSEVVSLLNMGKIESVNLTEWLAVNHISLLHNTLPEIGLQNYIDEISNAVNNLKEKTIMKVIPTIGGKLLEILSKKSEEDYSAYFLPLAMHRSDSVRCWAAYVIGLNRDLSITEKLSQIKPFAADKHFGVREIAWMAVRESITQELTKSITILEKWTVENDENIRRFAIESTRPRGVWCKHITQLKQCPELAISLLERVKSDPKKYVQDSVGNWLNDASKSHPEWVNVLCDEWLRTSDTKETKRIVTRAKRTITKKK
ncbi:DNA alkylation repair protein [Aneurinibacillus uraniidurans]|uniref:DNA alkylation repair protein n=1 Tax=Aneurinibacillus uraniidurans TaxID=2966586 RepID=UPI00234A733F|nr:DNA alkylation repair protein [Aneurinibacillus sp. B1]WCN39761.1 DNA alkylation repair protein [Aneurinibacillus sp. B1]